MTEHAKHPGRISRKALKEPDEFLTLTGQALAWSEEHRTKLLAALGVAIVLGAGLLAFGRYRASRVDAAAEAFHGAHALFQAARFGDAATAFADVQREFPGTPFAGLAGLYRGHALGRGGDASAAATAYQEYLAAGHAADYLRQEALVGLAHAREAAEDVAGARAAFEEAGALEGPFRTDALLGAARAYEAAGESTKARDVYVKLLGQNPDAELQAMLHSKLPADAATAMSTQSTNVRFAPK
ncbi:MAG: tetratricopeptide repeat protein [Candidatus Binatia bacterium]